MKAFKTLRDGGFAVGTLMMADSMLTAEVAARAGFDFICLDRQHGLIDDATLWAQLGAVGRLGRADAWVRIPWNSPADAMRALDAGAVGIIAPMLSDRADAEALVRACRYPPMGERSWGPLRAGMDDPVGYTDAANTDLFIAAMIETKSGFENVQAIAETPGLDAVYVGPNDLSFALGNWQPAMPDDPKFIEALKHITAVAKKAGKLSGMHCANVEMARAARDWGFNFATVSTETGFMAEAASAAVKAVRAK